MASEESKEDMVTEFANITGVDAMRAQFYLESSGWQLQIALGSFYEEDDRSMDVSDELPTAPRQPDLLEEVTPPPVSSQPTTGRPKTNRIVTVNDMKKNENTDEEEEGQRFYAGGSDHSGQQVVGPKKKKTSEIVENLFKKAKEHGAEEVTAGSNPINPSKPRNFTGVGYRLGDTEDTPSKPVDGEQFKQQQKEFHCKVKLWKNGFCVNDEELRDYKDPTNAAFLGSISKGEIPRELLQQAKGGEVHLDMEDRHEEEYTAPKPKLKAFSGVGNMLGSPTPNVISSAKPTTAASSSGSVGQQAIKVDASQPQTNIQLRLADGSRLVGKFNHSHTLGDIRNFIVAKMNVKNNGSPEKVVKEETKNVTSSKNVDKGKGENVALKRRSWTTQQKVDIIQWHRENNSSQSSTAMLFGCDRKCIREWDRNYEELLLLSGASELKKKKRIHSGQRPLSYEMDHQLLEFLEQQRNNGIVVTNDMLRNKAIEISKQLNIDNFNASHGWMWRWKKRSNVVMQFGTNEHLANDSQEQILQFQRAVINKRKSLNLSKFQIVNMHQIVVMFNDDSTNDDMLKQTHEADTDLPITYGTEGMPLKSNGKDLPKNDREILTDDCDELMQVLTTEGTEDLLDVLTDDNEEEVVIQLTSCEGSGEELIHVETKKEKEKTIQKTGFSVCLCTCANGQKLPACIVFKKQNGDIVPETKASFCMPTNVRVGASSNGQIHSKWLKNRLDVLRNFDENMPLLLILDRHNICNANATCKLFENVNIKTVCKPPGCTSIFQMMDACVNMIFKQRFHQLWKTWLLANKQKNPTSSTRLPSRYQVINWVSEAWYAVSEEKIKNMFLKCGISNTLDGSEDSKIMVLREFPKDETKNELTLLSFSENSSVLFKGFGDEDEYGI